MNKGGKTIPISCFRCDKSATIESSTCKHVYKEGGKCHYPYIERNESKFEGIQHFQCHEPKS